MSRLVSFRIPPEYVLARALPSPAETACGVKQGWLFPSDAVAIAVEKFERGCPLTPAEEALALLLSDDLDRVSDLMSELETGSEPTESRERLWLFLALDWLRDHRGDYDDPYEVIDMLYADFHYPSDIASLVRWMPVPEGEPTGATAIDERWRTYLDSTRSEYAVRADKECPD